ncbi:MAG: type VII secretion protein EssC [Ruminococcaceae bacterium]|nr:type VII secretion protein EssC [Oscillospiraceae bacterium]
MANMEVNTPCFQNDWEVARMNKNGAHGFHLLLISQDDELCDLWLPSTPEGQFKFSENHSHRFVSVIARDGEWVVVCRAPAFFLNTPDDNAYEARIKDRMALEIECEDRSYILYAEETVDEQRKFKNYFVDADVKLVIGSRPDCDICYANPYVAPRYAVLCREKRKWRLHDESNTFGLYVNGSRTYDAELEQGDVISLFGLRIIAGSGYLAINNEMGEVSLGANLRSSMEYQGGYARYYGQEAQESETECFNRQPRKRSGWEPRTITVEGPPMSMSSTQIPLMLRMGSSLVMGGAAALAGNFMTLITSVLFPFLSSKYTDKQRQEYERLRVSKYSEYLDKKYAEIMDACQEELAMLKQKYPHLASVADSVMDQSRLWERRPIDDDFLHIRVGTGVQPASAIIDYPMRRFELESDVLEDKMYALAEGAYTLENAPITLSLTDTMVTGIVGQRDLVLRFLRDMVMQIAAFHSYDEVKMLFLLKESELEQLDSLRYLPHVWDDQKTIRFVATNEAEVYLLGEYIKNQLDTAFEDKKQWRDILKSRPYYLIFALDKKLLESHEIMKEILQSETNCAASIVAVYDDLPKETQKILNVVSEYGNTCTTLSANGAEEILFSLDSCEENKISLAMRMLANTNIKSVTQSLTLPKMVTFLEMFGVGRLEQLNPLKRWEENNPVKSLATPVGVAEDGSAFMLDLHEKRQGPHGLVAGMTGSGKSEFLITYILSLAVNYHPDEVAFVLIDYKGGGLADAFENPRTGIKLPHLAGTITNLDGASIQRSLMSIESELVRRQKVFSEVSKRFDEGSMNIYTYQKLHRAGKVTEPMPHLFIISDEFAELKQQQPEFMAKLISAARIGRSLGVHLILATQKPSGVVDDQIRSNTKFRVCLRVQEKADSQDMLKRPEAAELTDTGRFYLQVGYNEYFAMGQSAWCGAAYEPQDVMKVQKDDALEFLDITGQVVAKAKPKVKKTPSGMKQIGAVVQYLSKLAENQNIHIRQLCPPQLPHKIDLETLQGAEQNQERLPMTVLLGKVDDPENQCQFPLTLDMAACQNLLIAGEASSGKTSMVQSILYSLTHQLTAQDLNLYILDYSSRLLKMFDPLPHCGAVLYEEDSNMLDAFFNLVGQIIEERKRLYTELGVDDFESARAVKRLPLVVVVIDNYSGFTSNKKGDSLSYKLADYVKESACYGVKFLITVNRMADLNSRMKRAVGDSICLYQEDKYGYTDVLGIKAGYTPPEMPGRGLCLQAGRILEYQCAQFRTALSRKEQLLQMKEELARLAQKSDRAFEARRLPVTDETIEYRDFAGQFARGRIPLGYSKATGNPVVLPLKQYTSLCLYFGNTEGVVPVMENLLYVAKREAMEVWIMHRNENSIYDSESPVHVDPMLLENADRLACTNENQLLLQKALVAIMSQRRKYLEDYCKDHGIQVDEEQMHLAAFTPMLEQTTPILLIIESLADFCNVLSPIAGMSYQKLTEKLAKRNVYLVACTEPEDHTLYKENLFSEVLKKNMCLLLGGQFQKQKLCNVPSTPATDKVMPYNLGIMRYREQYHPIVMPCGVLEVKAEDADLKSIF